MKALRVGLLGCGCDQRCCFRELHLTSFGPLAVPARVSFAAMLLTVRKPWSIPLPRMSVSVITGPLRQELTHRYCCRQLP